MATIKLQGVSGEQNAKEVNELRIGDTIMWNYGITSEVLGITLSETGKTAVITLKSNEDGEVRERKMRTSTLVAVVEGTEEAPEEEAQATEETPEEAQEVQEAEEETATEEVPEEVHEAEATVVKGKTVTTYTTKGEQIIEVWKNRKEALNDVRNMLNGCETVEDIMKSMIDSTLWIEYKDGSHYYASEDEVEGKLRLKKKGNVHIKAIYSTNASTMQVWGEYQIENINDTEEAYNSIEEMLENDSEDKCWNITVA